MATYVFLISLVLLNCSGRNLILRLPMMSPACRPTLLSVVSRLLKRFKIAEIISSRAETKYVSHPWFTIFLQSIRAHKMFPIKMKPSEVLWNDFSPCGVSFALCSLLIQPIFNFHTLIELLYHIFVQKNSGSVPELTQADFSYCSPKFHSFTFWLWIKDILHLRQQPKCTFLGWETDV